jgi:hypothetical protein
VRITGVGKLVAAFVMFLAASALAIHEAKSPQPPETRAAPRVDETPPPIDHAPPSRAIRDEVPPWIKYAAPPPPPPTMRIETPPRRVFIEESEITVSGDDIPDAVDKCPDQPNDSDDNDGCPEPEGLKDRIILID